MKYTIIFITFLLVSLKAFEQAEIPYAMKIQHIGVGDKDIYAIYVIDSLEMDSVKSMNYDKEASTILYANGETLVNLYIPFKSLKYNDTIAILKVYEFGTF